MSVSEYECARAGVHLCVLVWYMRITLVFLSEFIDGDNVLASSQGIDDSRTTWGMVALIAPCLSPFHRSSQALLLVGLAKVSLPRLVGDTKYFWHCVWLARMVVHPM